MKKLAYTLAEVLIAVCIVGVISAIMIGLLNKAAPDTNKITYLKTYSTLTKAVKTIAKDPSLFQQTQVFDSRESAHYVVNLDIHKYPFLDYSQPSNPDFQGEAYQGNVKFGNLLKDALNGTSIATVPSGATNYFSTPDGKLWTVATVFNNEGLVGSAQNPSGKVLFYSKITVDINGNKEPNSVYNDNLNKAPDQFEFCVGANGKIKAIDKYGRNYLKNRRTLTRKKVDVSNENDLDWWEFVRGATLELNTKNIISINDTTPTPEPDPEPEPNPEPNPTPPNPNPLDPFPFEPINPLPVLPVDPLLPIPNIPWSPIIPINPVNPPGNEEPDEPEEPSAPTAADYPCMNETGIRALLTGGTYTTYYGTLQEANIDGETYANGFPAGRCFRQPIKTEAQNKINAILGEMVARLKSEAEKDTSLFATPSGADNYNAYVAMLNSAKYTVERYYETVLYYIEDNNSGGAHSYASYKNEAYRQRLHVYCSSFRSIAMLCSGNGYYNGSTYMSDSAPSNTSYDDQQNPSPLEWNLQYGQRSFRSTSDANSYLKNAFSSNNPASGLILVEDVYTFGDNEYAITININTVREKFIQAIKAEYKLAYSKNIKDIQTSTLSNDFRLITYGATNAYLGWDICGSNIFPMIWND